MAKKQFELRPAGPGEANLFYTMTQNEDKSHGTIGHLRSDFGSGNEFWHTWWPHNDDTLNTPEFKAEFGAFVDSQRKKDGPMKDLAAMGKYCNRHTEGLLSENVYGYIAESEHYRYCLRCTPLRGWYNAYIYIYDKREQALYIGREQTAPEASHQRLILYMPIHGEMPGQDIDDYLNTYAGRIGGHTLLAFKDIIEKALVKHREPEEVRRGLMRWYGKDDGVNAKVYSAFFGVEERAGSLWGTVTCMVEGELTAQELEALKEDIEGQASDGWGEGFEQKDLETCEGILHLHLWDSQNWQLMTEAEFSQRYEQAQALEL